MATILIEKESEERIAVKFEYLPDIVAKVKTINGRDWNIKGKYWTVPYTDTIIEQLCRIFIKDVIFIDGTICRTVDPNQRRDNFEASAILKDLDRELIIK